jgi:hypothetical protein
MNRAYVRATLHYEKQRKSFVYTQKQFLNKIQNKRQNKKIKNQKEILLKQNRNDQNKMCSSMSCSPDTQICKNLNCSSMHNVKYVLQREMGFLKYSDKFKQTTNPLYSRYICTFGLGPCVAFAGYCKNNKVAFVTHFDHMTFVEGSINMLSYQLSTRLILPAAIEAIIIGGEKGVSDELIMKIESALKTHNDIPFVVIKKNVCGSGDRSLSSSIAIDIETGEFFDNVINPTLSDVEMSRLTKFTWEVMFDSNLSRKYLRCIDIN